MKLEVFESVNVMYDLNDFKFEKEGYHFWVNFDCKCDKNLVYFILDSESYGLVNMINRFGCNHLVTNIEMITAMAILCLY